MKRDRFESEYERVRRMAGLAAPEFPEVNAHGQHAREVGEPRPLDDGFRERMAETARIDAEAAAKRRIHADALTARSNELVRLAEYARAGVAPRQGVSLSLLLNLGWRIERVGDENVLVAPAVNRSTGKRRQDYERENS